jgi:hypothetical protein
MFGTNKRTAQPVETPEPQKQAPRTGGRKPKPDDGGTGGTNPQPGPKPTPEGDYLISELKRCFAKDGPNGDLLPYVETVERTLADMASALYQLRQRLNKKNLTVRLDDGTRGRI